MDKDLGLLIRITSNHLSRAFDHFGSSIGLTGTQVLIIDFLHKFGDGKDVFQKDVEAEFNIRRSSATNILQLMEKSGLIQRAPVTSDARLKKIILTEKALQTQQQIVDYKAKIEQEITSQATAGELKTFRKVLNQIIAKLE